MTPTGLSRCSNILWIHRSVAIFISWLIGVVLFLTSLDVAFSGCPWLGLGSHHDVGLPALTVAISSIFDLWILLMVSGTVARHHRSHRDSSYCRMTRSISPTCHKLSRRLPVCSYFPQFIFCIFCTSSACFSVITTALYSSCRMSLPQPVPPSWKVCLECFILPSTEYLFNHLSLGSWKVVEWLTHQGLPIPWNIPWN